MADLLQPTIRYARDGVPLPPVIATAFPESASESVLLANFYKTYMPDGKALKAGDVFRNPDIAHTLEQIAKGGRDVFYKGAIAETIDAYMREVGGHLRKEDFAAHTGDWVEPVSTTYRGYEVYELPPNGQGIAALQMLNILEGYDLKRMGHNSADYLHVHIEAKKLAFADRARYYADPAFADLPVEELISKAYADERRALIDMNQARQQVDAGATNLSMGDTIYLTVADSDGMMVSLIQSIFYEWGSGLVPDGLGFALQNRGALFTMEKGHPNVYEPGKRPFHTIIPAFMMKDGVPFLSFGLMGGAMQPQGHAQVLSNIIDFGMNVQEAGDAVRYRHTGSSQPTGQVMTDGGLVQLESGIDPAVVEALRRRGHTVVVGEGFFGGYQAIRWDPMQKVYHGASEMRKDGQAAGY
jgi:gamma-glutamyltranspeptidase/glutathione hydrolase